MESLRAAVKLPVEADSAAGAEEPRGSHEGATDSLRSGTDGRWRRAFARRASHRSAACGHLASCLLAAGAEAVRSPRALEEPVTRSAQSEAAAREGAPPPYFRP